jgi:hypothetical protein
VLRDPRRARSSTACDAPDPVNWQERIEVLHAADGYRTSEDFAAALCGALAQGSS